MSHCTDKFGQLVTVGSQIKLVELSSHFLDSLPADEYAEISSMIGEVFHVCNIDDQGCAWIRKDWHYPDEGHIVDHSLGLAPHEMELVAAAA